MAMIGHRLRISRSAAGLSLRQLQVPGSSHRVSAQAISKYERNESMPSSGVLIALADALDVSVDYLAGDEDLVLEAVEFRKKRLTGKAPGSPRRSKGGTPSRTLPRGRGDTRPAERRLGQAPRSPLAGHTRSVGSRTGRYGAAHPLGPRSRSHTEPGRDPRRAGHQGARHGPPRHRRPDRAGSPQDREPPQRSSLSTGETGANDSASPISHELGHMVLDVSSEAEGGESRAPVRGRLPHAAGNAARRDRQAPQVDGLERTLRAQAHLRRQRSGPHLSLQRPRNLQRHAFPVPLRRIFPPRMAQPRPTRSLMPRRARCRGVSSDCASVPWPKAPFPMPKPRNSSESRYAS